MASAKKLASGSWRCLVYSHTEPEFDKKGAPVIDPKTKKQKQKRIYKSFTCDVQGPKGKRMAEQMAADWAAEKENSTNTQDITVGEAIDRYIQGREKVLSPRTIMDYKRIRNKELPTIMDLKIATISQEDIQAAINLDARTHSPKTVRNSHGLISAVMGLYRPNFAIKTKLPKKVRPDIYVPTDADVALLMRAAAGNDLELPILLAAFGPMRRGEISALDAKDISGCVVHVTQNMVLTEDYKWVIKAPKSYAGDRYIDYPQFVADKWSGRYGRIVSLTPNQITDRFGELLKKLELPHFRFHDLRHYSASIQHALGIPDAYIMQRGGWGNDGVLKAVYRHTMSDKSQEMTDRANEHFKTLCNTKCNTK